MQIKDFFNLYIIGVLLPLLTSVAVFTNADSLSSSDVFETTVIHTQAKDTIKSKKRSLQMRLEELKEVGKPFLTLLILSFIIGFYLQSIAFKNLSLATRHKAFKTAGELAFWGIFILMISILSIGVLNLELQILFFIGAILISILILFIASIYLSTAFFTLQEDYNLSQSDQILKRTTLYGTKDRKYGLKTGNLLRGLQKK